MLSETGVESVVQDCAAEMLLKLGVLQKSGEQHLNLQSKERTEAKPQSNAKRKRGSDDESGQPRNQAPQTKAGYVPTVQVQARH